MGSYGCLWLLGVKIYSFLFFGICKKCPRNEVNFEKKVIKHNKNMVENNSKGYVEEWNKVFPKE